MHTRFIYFFGRGIVPVYNVLSTENDTICTFTVFLTIILGGDHFKDRIIQAVL